MERALIVLLVGLLSAFFVDAKPKGNEQSLEGPGGLKAYVGSRGGGIRQYREMSDGPGGKGKRRSGVIEIRLGRIRETNGTDSSEQPGPGRPRRPELESPDDVDFNVENRKDKNLQRRGGAVIKGDCVILRSSLKEVNDSVLTLTVCTVKDNGTLVIGDEDTEILSGQLKFTLQLDNWPWSSDGQFVDVDVIIKVPGGRRVSEKDRGGSTMGRKRPVTYNLGDNSVASFPKKVELDSNTVVDMPDGFPSAPRARGNKYVITLRFPRFNSTVFYDPVFDLLGATLSDIIPDGGTAPFPAILPLSVALLLAFTANKFALRA